MKKKKFVLKPKHLGRISNDVHRRVITNAVNEGLTVDEFLNILIGNWEIARKKQFDTV